MPERVDAITVVTCGAQGGPSYDGLAGGRGGRVTATIPVTPLEELGVIVGGAGGTGETDSGGFNGGGKGGGVFGTPFGEGGAGGGGGATEVRRGEGVLLVAGGGGGRGQSVSLLGNYAGGAGGAGGASDGDGTSGTSNSVFSVPGGGGGGGAPGGAAGGTPGVGAEGGAIFVQPLGAGGPGGGGGGGVIGGGGGGGGDPDFAVNGAASGGGGGGGWSVIFDPASTNRSADDGHTDCTGDGFVSITWDDPTTPSSQPDVLIHDGASFVGDGIYGPGQAARRDAARGQRVSYRFRIQNDGTAPDHFVLAGTGTVDSYKLDGVDITAAVRAGTFETELDPGAFVTVRAKVTPPPSAALGSTLRNRLTATSATDPTLRDHARGITKIVA